MEFAKVFDELKEQISSAAASIFPNHKEVAVKDADVFLNTSKQKLQTWAEAVAAGEMTAADLEWLLKSQQSLKEMKGLYDKGLARIKIDEFQNQILSAVTSVLSKLKP